MQTNWKPFSLCVAVSRNNGIGKDGNLPWPMLSRDLKHFAQVTSSVEPMAQTEARKAKEMVMLQAGLDVHEAAPTKATPQFRNAVVMGRKTWASIPEAKRPLVNRLNVVLTRDETFAQTLPADENNSTQVKSSFEEAMSSLSSDPTVNEIHVIGGSSLFELSLGKYSEHCKLIFLTRINKEFDCDVFMPEGWKDEKAWPKLFVSQTMSDKDVTYDFCVIGNRHLMQKHPQMVPTRILAGLKPH